MSYDVELANEFKKRDNESKVGIIVGTVVNINPLSISIYNGKAIFTGEDLYVCKNATEYTMPVTTGTDGIATHEGLKEGDRVAVMATEDNQKLFIIDKLI